MERSPFFSHPRAARERDDSGEYEFVAHLEKGHMFQIIQLLDIGGNCWHCWCSDAVQQVVEEHGGRVHQTRQEQGLQGLRPSHIIKHLDYFPSLSIPIWIPHRQTWNFSKKLHDQIFGRKNFTHWKCVNLDYFRHQETAKMHYYQ